MNANEIHEYITELERKANDWKEMSDEFEKFPKILPCPECKRQIVSVENTPNLNRYHNCINSFYDGSDCVFCQERFNDRYKWCPTKFQAIEYWNEKVREYKNNKEMQKDPKDLPLYRCKCRLPEGMEVNDENCTHEKTSVWLVAVDRELFFANRCNRCLKYDGGGLHLTLTNARALFKYQKLKENIIWIKEV